MERRLDALTGHVENLAKEARTSQRSAIRPKSVAPILGSWSEIDRPSSSASVGLPMTAGLGSLWNEPADP